jgi:long-chain fatty acid transport protein
MFRAPEKAGRLSVVLAASTAMLTPMLTPLAHGEGFRNPPPGEFSLARAGGRRAQIDNAEAAYHNPANLTDLSTTSAEISPMFVYMKVDHEGAGQTAQTKDPFKFLPDFFANIPVISNKLAFGFALTTPFGLANEWQTDKGLFANPDPTKGGWRYAAPYYAGLTTIDGSPSVAYRFNDHISVGAGVDVIWSQLNFKQFFPTFLLPLPGGPYPETIVRAKGDGFALGANAGVTVNLTEKQRLAFTYRSPFTVDYDGRVRFDSEILPKSDFSTSVKFPTIVGAGYAIELSDTVRLETDFEWLEFSNFNTLGINAGANAFLNQTVQEKWRNTFTVGIAGDWHFHENWTWRAGYQYYQTPVPDSTFSPTIPDSNQNAFTTGIDFAQGHHHAGLSYGYIRYDDRNINNTAYLFNGHYEMQVHLLALQYTYAF